MNIIVNRGRQQTIRLMYMRAYTMSKQQQHLSQAQRDAKKAAVLGIGKKGRFPYVILIICVVLAAGGGIWYVMKGGITVSSAVTQPAATPQTAAGAPQTASVTSQTSANTPAEQVTHPVSLFIGGQAQFFEYKAGDLTIKYFIVKSSDGVIRAAFNACDVCWPAGKGYRQEGDDMVCNNCGRHFKTTLINEVQGGCNPAPLNRKIENNNVIIAVKDILPGKQYFDLANRRG
jgi:hypothetical protein